MNSLKLRIQEDMKDAMRTKDASRLGVIRLLMAAIKQREVDERITLDDPNIIQVLNKMVKQRRESIVQYEAGNRKDLAEKEQQEIDILQVYLPTQLGQAEINQAIQSAIQATSATSIKDMGKVMNILKEQLAGQADMALVGTQVKDILNRQS